MAQEISSRAPRGSGLFFGMTTHLDDVLTTIDREDDAAIERLCDWLRIPSVSADPAHKPDCRRAAEWAAGRLRESGFDEVRLVETGDVGVDGHGSGQPIVLAEIGAAPGYDGPKVLYYGHYDVQPADPIELWESGPFEPVIKPAVDGGPGERVVARGAVDDKGQSAMIVEAFAAWHASGAGPTGGVPALVLLEGEEETGSTNLERFVEAQRALLGSCDVCVISDTAMLGRGRPAITYGVRGLTYTEVTLHGPDQDLHSGLWGGKTVNPLNELVRVLGGLHDAQRRVTIPGFYDRVRELESAEKKAWAELGVDAAKALASIGLGPEADVGEAGYSFIEREWARPTADINGFVGGYTGKGAKTVIPSKASAKVSFRLVADQRPAEIREAFFAWCREQTPPGCRWEFADHGGGEPATVATDSPVLGAARRAIEAAMGVEPALIKSGGSIPVAGMLKAGLGLETIFMGFGLDDDRMHSPNEKFELSCFRAGWRSHAHLIAELRAMGGLD